MPVEQRIFEVRRNFLAGKVELYTLDEPPVQVAFDASATPLPEDFAIMHCETGPEGLRVLGPVEAFARQLPAELRARLDAPPDGRPEIAVLACTRNVTQVEFERRCSELGVAGTHIHVRDVGVIAGFPRAFVVIPMNIVGAPPPTIVSAVNALVTFALVKLRAHLASEAAKPAGEWIIVADEAGPASDYREDVWAPTRMIFVAIPAASQLAFLGLGFHSMYNRESMRTALRDLLHEKRAVVYSFKWESGAPVGNVKSPYGGSAHWDLWRLCTALVLEDIVERHGAKDVTFLFEQVGALEPKSAAPVLELIKTFSRQEGRAGREAVKAAAHVLTKDGHPWLGYADACGMILRLPNEGEEALLRDVRKRTRDYPFDKANLERLGLVIEQAGAKPEVFLAAAAALPAGAVRMYGDVLEPALQAAAARLGKSAFPTVVERLVASLKSEPAAYAAVELVLKPIIRVETQFADVLAAFPALRYGFQFAKISIANHAAAVGDALKALAEWDALVAAGEKPAPDTADMVEILRGGLETNRFDFAAAARIAEARLALRAGAADYTVTILRSCCMQWQALAGKAAEACDHFAAIEAVPMPTPEDRARYYIYKAHILIDLADYSAAAVALAAAAGEPTLPLDGALLDENLQRSPYWWQTVVKWWALQGVPIPGIAERVAKPPEAWRNPFDMILYWSAVGLLPHNRRTAKRLAVRFAKQCAVEGKHDRDAVGVIRALMCEDLAVRGLVDPDAAQRYLTRVLSQSKAETRHWVQANRTAVATNPGDALAPLRFNYR